MNRSTLSLFVLIGLATTALASPDVLLQPGKLLADIGVGATVPANPVNTYLQQLTEREQSSLFASRHCGSTGNGRRSGSRWRS
jgi:hypothetical protein